MKMKNRINMHFNSGSILATALGFCVLILLGCKSGATANDTPLDQAPAKPFLHFQKTSCFGTCPAYQAAIASDGSVTFAGFAYVPTTDTLFFKLTPSALDSLKTAVHHLKYTELQDLYPTQWSDMPSTLTTFYQDGKSVKRIKHTEGGPATLRQFQDNLHGLLLKMAEVEAKNTLPKK
jgi:hypothetical protein